ncbi:hypothetical protein [Hydrogenophaga sp.]|uniref:hypothetical protein n=1 Tax=Hydrogenophaga sp. TaxID=1904254 RepID=UPI002728D0D1|nr:hypothetical protein [Hydrogenophaga sp.]MDO9437355.1 hypothetical protein [Hydrogenophaga sp.]
MKQDRPVGPFQLGCVLQQARALGNRQPIEEGNQINLDDGDGHALTIERVKIKEEPSRNDGPC